MGWYDGVSDLKTARARVETAFYAPIGMMSPLWLAFGAAASAGATFWLMTRLAKPVNIEAKLAPSGEAPAAEDASIDTVASSPGEEAKINAFDNEGDETEMARPVADDLMLLVGVGPKIATALAERGIERFEQLAAWTEQDLAAFDAALDLRGRAIRAGFVVQARKLVGGEA